MTDTDWTRYLRRAFVVGAFGFVALLTGAGSLRAADDDEDTRPPSLEDSILRGIGLKSSKPDIDYRERSPLVVPPNRDLPPPESTGGKNAAWPSDLDPKRRVDPVARRPDAGKPVDWKESSTSKVAEPSDLGKIFSGGFSGAFRKLGGAEETEIGTFTAEPPRASLTEPPAGYKTPSPNAPYGLTMGDKFNRVEKEVDPGKTQR